MAGDLFVDEHAIDSVDVAFALGSAGAAFALDLAGATFALDLEGAAFDLDLPGGAFALDLADVAFALYLAGAAFALDLEGVAPALGSEEVTSNLTSMGVVCPLGLVGVASPWDSAGVASVFDFAATALFLDADVEDGLVVASLLFVVVVEGALVFPEGSFLGAWAESFLTWSSNGAGSGGPATKTLAVPGVMNLSCGVQRGSIWAVQFPLTVPFMHGDALSTW